MDGFAGDGWVSPWRAAWRGFRASPAGVHGLGALAAVCCGGLLEPVLSAGTPVSGGAGQAVVAALDAVAASLLLGLAAAVLAAVVALVWGGGAALAGGRAGMRLMAPAGVLGALPLPLLPLMAGGLLDPDLVLFAVVLGLAAAPVPAMAVHGTVAAALRSDMVAAARAAGLSEGAVLARRVLPAMAVPLLAACWSAWPRALAMEGLAGLVHLGPARGAPDEAATWGALLGDAVAGGGPLDLLGPVLLLAVTLWALGAIGGGLIHAAAVFVPGGRREIP